MRVGLSVYSGGLININVSRGIPGKVGEFDRTGK